MSTSPKLLSQNFYLILIKPSYYKTHSPLNHIPNTYKYSNFSFPLSEILLKLCEGSHLLIGSEKKNLTFILFASCFGDIFRNPALDNIGGPSKSNQAFLTVMTQDLS